MTIASRIQERGIVEVVHFTTNRGFVGMLASRRLYSRHRLHFDEYLEHQWMANSVSRPETAEGFDKKENWLDYVNLSISEINSRFLLVSSRWHQDSDYWWIILSFDSSIMCDDGVYFATTNNGYDLCSRKGGLEGFDALFVPVVGRKLPSWRAYRLDREPRLPTCEQAEVLYPGYVDLHALRRVYVREGEQADRVEGWLREFEMTWVEVIVNEQKFVGRPN
ncbi:DarT ssDNA thymidine ADP-ribosyltransferase family protein [Xanthomonas rydalmerensis]|uniref:DarT ssDNA thymidine ADP-ribosyltransferase family protein n=1 Tax=Xanthomonas rydalmerensis TaxID=3046274 RepID=A0ABZ0JJF3_9XANT|nr:DarT ssDNA thymidine ADP-ribosyltransferase family protein [Xanthomonas sp. DM-2023]WOS39911.1 DarT ssDNA thymidine ADP-ribosyltransferase family protein [Xanthomonas sp. DM-2023]WOS44095.1 DarT ssDNA thymidine ADP-ribosyltransferase family protein [Xanthomonas sp. DM-2023]WOS48275.1 DarT ssDNA thymidine ADP-ribosyltransferase family protein [Xanthomonas sp. DM-2023]WOS52454.1 DarT ssDNA thymidine ADP-ribosyltransferase family protein [Xanthomonas sp. DM-2023]WOS56638.1 DarT ssDNA thymidine